MPDAFNLGRHEGLIERLVAGQKEMAEGQLLIVTRLGVIENTLAERRGERRIGTALWASSSGALGALIVFLTRAWLAGHGTVTP